MTTVEKSIQIEAPLSVVYDQWTQFEDFPAFMHGVDRIQQVDDTHLRWDVSIGGVDRAFDAEVTEQVPDDRIAWKSTGGPHHAGVVTFHRVSDEETRVMLQLDWEPEGFVEKAGSALQFDDRQVASDLERFKELIENNGFASGSWRGEVPRDTDATGG
ncbi:MAG: SRPBCC family protein [Actinomycetales bacterium]|nr:SRPBCC family protein [Actinomycetales bacterium]